MACIALACSSSSAGTRRTASDHFQSAHWTCERRVEYGTRGHRRPVQFEAWMEDDRALITATVNDGDEVRVLTIGSDGHAWVDGRTNGKAFSALDPDERTMDIPSVDFAFRAADCRGRGRRVTTGTFDRHPFVRYDCVDADSTKRIYYYATDLQNFPVHATIMYPGGTVVIYDAKSVEVPASIPDSLLQKPSGVQFDPSPA